MGTRFATTKTDTGDRCSISPGERKVHAGSSGMEGIFHEAITTGSMRERRKAFKVRVM